MIPLHDDNPTTIRPLFTIGFIAINILVFLFQMTLGERSGEIFVFQFGAIPGVVTGQAALPPGLEAIPPWLSLFSSMFLHGGFMHIAGNMLYLWIFGNNIEDAMGHVRFVIFYLVSGLAAAVAHIATDPSSRIPMVGASGAISGVLGAYLLLYPHARVLVLVPMGFFTQTLWIPAGYVLGFWIVFQFLNGMIDPGEGGGVAWFAHIGGFVAGMVLVHPFKRRNLPAPRSSRSRSRNFRIL